MHLRPLPRIFAGFAAIFCLAHVARAADGVDIGGASQVFDTVEYDEPFLPSATGAAWTAIDAQLNILATKLPYSADYLRSYFLEGRTVWWFVNVKLKPAPAGTPTDTVVTYRREQIAANQGGIVQVRKDAFGELDDDGKATLLMHEVLISAVSNEIGWSGTNVRLMSRYLLNPNLGGFSAVNVLNFLRQMTGPQAAEFQRWLAFDEDQYSTDQNVHVQEVTSGLRRDLVTTVLRGPLTGMKLTILRPNGVYDDLTHTIYDTNGTWFARSNGLRRAVDPETLCADLRYGGSDDWRLPSEAELLDLYAINFLETRFPTVDSVFANPTTHDEEITYMAFANRDQGLTCLRGDASCLRYAMSLEMSDVPYLCVQSH